MVKTNSEYRSIRKKLMAAIAMVLVASIMVVSSSYAWFTLSTAPEVKGIQTSVGSNGNLEIALRATKDGDITTSTGAAFPAANNYWGNLLDLSSETYHLNDITLMPSALITSKITDATKSYPTNADGVLVDANGEVIEAGVKEYENLTTDENKAKADAAATDIPATYGFQNASQGAFIKTPVYGVDGRMSAFNTSSFSSVYDTALKGFPASSTVSNYGVRALGTSSGMSPAQLALLDAKRAVSAAATNARNGAINSLNTDAIKIANLAVKDQLGEAIDASDIANIRAAITNLQNIAAILEDAVRSAVVALGVSQGLTFDKSAVQFGASEITVTGVALQWSKADSNEEDDINDGFDHTAKQAMLIEAYGKITGMKSDLAEVSNNIAPYEAAGAAMPAYTDLVNIITKILNPNDILINGKTVAQYGGLASLATSLMNGTPEITIKAGIYADIASFTNNYSTTASMHVEGNFSSFGEINTNVTVNIATEVDEPTGGWYLKSTEGWLSNLSVSDDGGESLISDTFGYAIDLAFRTNAANSNLLLQTEAANRISEESGAATQGAGSYMQFTSTNPDFTVEQMANLMGSIRVVFTDDATGNIFAVAGLDVGEETVQEVDEATGKKYYWSTDEPPVKVLEDAPTADLAKPVYVQAEDMNGNLLYVDKDTGNMTTESNNGLNEPLYSIPNYEVDPATKTVKAKLYLYNFSINETGVVDLSGIAGDQSIMALVQNATEYLTAVVYLDGNEVDNADVAINGDSMTGTLNLQFASDADLEPMQYTFGDKLLAPAVSLAGNNLTITAVDGADTYQIYANGMNIGSVKDVSAPFDLAAGVASLGDKAPAGMTVSITVVAQGANKTQSDASAPVTWTVPTANP
ncbi:MAG: hypothetical protein IJ412_05170 [Oscillospiraceae bacterium]|nr:hypothetical protein [Oscillospiraceae bacterium]